MRIKSTLSIMNQTEFMFECHDLFTLKKWFKLTYLDLLI